MLETNLKSKKADISLLFSLEQVTGLEPVISAWKANVFPLHYTCNADDEVLRSY